MKNVWIKNVWIIDDSDDHYQLTAEEIREALPGINLTRFEYPLDAWKASGKPDAFVIDMSAIGSIMQPELYSPICSLLGKFPRANVIISSAMSARIVEEIATDVREQCPDSLVECVDWFDCKPNKSLIEILKRIL